MDSESGSRVAYYPKGILGPIELLSVMVPIGALSYEAWLSALADRVSDMVSGERDPLTASLYACDRLECRPCREPSQLGQYLVQHNLMFQTFINCSFTDDSPFPETVTKEDEEARDAIKNTDFKTWLDLVEAFTSSEVLEIHKDVYKQLLAENPYKRPKPIFDDELKPYVDLINKHLDPNCDFEDRDPNDCLVESFLYNFYCSLSHSNGKVSLLFLAPHNKGVGYKTLEELDAHVTSFNGSHALQISYTHSVKKKRFFSKPVYEPEYYFLRLESPLSADVIGVIRTLRDFYEGLFSFFNSHKFDVLMPEAQFDQEVDESFLTYLEDEILMLDVIKKYPNFPNIIDNH